MKNTISDLIVSSNIVIDSVVVPIESIIHIAHVVNGSVTNVACNCIVCRIIVAVDTVALGNTTYYPSDPLTVRHDKV